MIRMMVVLGYLLTTDQCFAQPAAVLGVGSNDCGRFLEASREHEQELLSRHAPPGQGLVGTERMALFVGFLDGFLSAENGHDATNRMVGGQVSLEAVVQWVENYCRAHPLDLFVNAAAALRVDLKTQGR